MKRKKEKNMLMSLNYFIIIIICLFSFNCYGDKLKIPTLHGIKTGIQNVAWQNIVSFYLIILFNICF